MKKTKISRRFYRFLEMLPGLMSWNIILFPIWGSFLIPKVVAYFVIAFLIFWFYQSFRSAILGIIGYFRIKAAEKIDWREKYQKRKKKSRLEWKKIKHVIIIPNYNESVEKLSQKYFRSLPIVVAGPCPG